MESIKQFLNFTNEQGEVITFFGGRVTLSQLIGFIILVMVVTFILKFVKKSFKIILLAICCVSAACYMGVVSPEQVKDVSEKIAQNGVDTYEKFAKMSDSIKIEDNNISIKVNDNWLNISDVDKFMKTAGDKVAVFVDDAQYVIEDAGIVELLSELKK